MLFYSPDFTFNAFTMKTGTIQDLKSSAFVSPLCLPLTTTSGHACATVRRPLAIPMPNVRPRFCSSRSRFSSLRMSGTGVIETDTGSSLASWLESNKATVNENLSLSPADARQQIGLSISSQASSSQLKGTELLSLPEALFLSSAKAQATLESECAAIRGANVNLAPASWLALQLLFERSKGAESIFAPLLEALPRPGELDSAPLWSETELEWLRGSTVYERAMEIAEGVQSEWSDLQGVVADLFETPETECSLEIYRWAVAIVDARGVSPGGKDELVLAPVASQLAPASGTEPSARVEAGNTGMFFNTKPSLRVVLTKELKPGEEVTLAYTEGTLRNADLLLERGTTIDVKSANAVEMEFSMTSMDRFFEDKVDILEEYGEECGTSVDTPGTNMTRSFELVGADYSLEREELGAAWEAPEELDNFLRLVCLGGGDAFLLEGVFRSEVWDHLSFPMSKENEKAVCATVIGASEDALEGYTLEEGDEAGDGVDERGRARFELAKTVVGGEQGVLKRAVESYRRRAGSLDAVEYYAERRLKALDLLRPVDESEIVDSESGGRVGRAFDENYY